MPVALLRSTDIHLINANSPQLSRAPWMGSRSHRSVLPAQPRAGRWASLSPRERSRSATNRRSVAKSASSARPSAIAPGHIAWPASSGSPSANTRKRQTSLPRRQMRMARLVTRDGPESRSVEASKHSHMALRCRYGRTLISVVTVASQSRPANTRSAVIVWRSAPASMFDGKLETPLRDADLPCYPRFMHNHHRRP